MTYAWALSHVCTMERFSSSYKPMGKPSELFTPKCSSIPRHGTRVSPAPQQQLRERYLQTRPSVQSV